MEKLRERLQKDQVLLPINWKDKKPVIIMSTTSSAEIENDIRTKNKYTERIVPRVIADYNRITNDQMKAGRRTVRSRRKKYSRIILVNASAYYKKIPPEGNAKMKEKKFRQVLVDQIISKYSI
jgi:hypothetical protein